MRRQTGLVMLAIGLAACAGDGGREFARYYDPRGFFTTNLPAANDLTVTPPQAAADGPSLLTGVVASPPAPSPAPQTGFGGGLAVTEPPPDQTIYQAIALETTGFEGLDQMGLYFLTGDPAIDVTVDQSVRIDGSPGRLLVADIVQQDQTTASIAAAFTLGKGGTGFVVAAVFPAGGWADEQDDFFRILDSFRAGVPPGLDSVPVVGPEV